MAMTRRFTSGYFLFAAAAATQTWMEAIQKFQAWLSAVGEPAES